MITISNTYQLPQGGQCDYCCNDIKSGVYIALVGYELITNLTKAHKDKGLEFDRLIIPAPFIPCSECLEFLDNNFTDVQVLALHCKVVDTFNKYYETDVPYPTLRLV